MDSLITATEANQRFPEMLRRVQAGERFTVTSRGRPVAQIGPPAHRSGKQSEDAFEAFLNSLPRVRATPWKREELYD